MQTRQSRHHSRTVWHALARILITSDYHASTYWGLLCIYTYIYHNYTSAYHQLLCIYMFAVYVRKEVEEGDFVERQRPLQREIPPNPLTVDSLEQSRPPSNNLEGRGRWKIRGSYVWEKVEEGDIVERQGPLQWEIPSARIEWVANLAWGYAVSVALGTWDKPSTHERYDAL